MNEPAYSVARAVAPHLLRHLTQHRATGDRQLHPPSVALLPDVATIERMIEAAFWASLRREEGYVPKISLAFLPPTETEHPLMFAQPLPLDPAALTKVAPAVERPGIHLGVWPIATHPMVWGTIRTIPPFCFVVEVAAPGLLVIKHRPRHDSRKFVNIAVLEGDGVKIVDESVSSLPECPGLLTTLLGFESMGARGDTLNILVELALSMRSHGRGGTLLVVASEDDSWRELMAPPMTYAVEPPFAELPALIAAQPSSPDLEWIEMLHRAVDALAGLTEVDGATVMTDRYELLAFGAKIRRRRGLPPVEHVIVTEPVEGNVPETTDPGRLGGTRHLSAAQFVHDQRNALALVASQDGRFTILAWSPSEQMVHAHRVDTLLL